MQKTSHIECSVKYDFELLNKRTRYGVDSMQSRKKRQKLSESGDAVVTAVREDAFEFDDNEADVPDGPQIKDSVKLSRSLFVRSLPATATTSSLTEYFSQSYPLKHATVVIDPVTKGSKGYGFITFADAEDAQKAKDEFNGSVFEGRKIKLEIAEPRNREVGDEGLAGRKRSQPSAAAAQAKAEREKQRLVNQKPPKLIVRNLPWSIKEPEQLAVLFRSYGKVKHATIPKSKPGTSAGFGFVVLRGRKNAENALAGVNGKVVDGRTLAVDWAIEKEAWETLKKEAEDDDAETLKSEDDESEIELGDVPPSDVEHMEMSSDRSDGYFDDDDDVKEQDQPQKIHDNSSTLFIRNLPFTCTDELLTEQFKHFGPVRYARVVLDNNTERPKGTGFVCFYNVRDALACVREAPRSDSLMTQTKTARSSASKMKQSLLEDTLADSSGRYTLDGRVLQVSRAVDRNEANRLATEGNSIRDARDRDKRRLYLLSEGTIPADSPLYHTLSPSELKMREESAKQRQALIKSNPSLSLSLTRLAIRNVPRNITSKDLKALARKAVVEFAKDVKNGDRVHLSKEELSRGGEEMKNADRDRKLKGKGIVRQAKIVYEGREGGKVAEDTGAGRSRGYGFIEYTSHRWALMGLRWLNGHAVRPGQGNTGPNLGVEVKAKRLIAEFAIENAQVVQRRREREIKAREPKAVAKNRALEQEGDSRKSSSRNTATTKTNKPSDLIRGRVSKKPSTLPGTTPDSQPRGLSKDDDSKDLARRQQLIGRKRMVRKLRKSALP